MPPPACSGRLQETRAGERGDAPGSPGTGRRLPGTASAPRGKQRPAGVLGAAIFPGGAAPRRRGVGVTPARPPGRPARPAPGTRGACALGPAAVRVPAPDPRPPTPARGARCAPLSPPGRRGRSRATSLPHARAAASHVPAGAGVAVYTPSTKLPAPPPRPRRRAIREPRPRRRVRSRAAAMGNGMNKVPCPPRARSRPLPPATSAWGGAAVCSGAPAPGPLPASGRAAPTAILGRG